MKTKTKLAPHAGPFVLALLALTGCFRAVEPVSFMVSDDATTALNNIVRALASNGLRTAEVDGQAGVIYTEWNAASVRYDPNDNETTQFVDRVIVTVQPGSQGALVMVRGDFRMCEQPGRGPIGPDISPCQPRTSVVPYEQRRIEELAGRLQATLATGMVVTTN